MGDNSEVLDAWLADVARRMDALAHDPAALDRLLASPTPLADAMLVLFHPWTSPDAATTQPQPYTAEMLMADVSPIPDALITFVSPPRVRWYHRLIPRRFR